MEDYNSKLAACREEINRIDDELVELVIKRMETAGKIGEIKKEAGLPVLNVKREEQVKERLLTKVPENLRESISSLYDTLFKISRDYQEKNHEI